MGQATGAGGTGGLVAAQAFQWQRKESSEVSGLPAEGRCRRVRLLLSGKALGSGEEPPPWGLLEPGFQQGTLPHVPQLPLTFDKRAARA